MSLKLETIYNYGGGAYLKYGGQLPESASGLISIENNNLYEYTNLSSNSLTFIFDKKEDVFNAVIEVTTNVNSNIYVGYLNDNGLVIPIPVIGSTSINANNQYKVIIVGNSYIIENVNVAKNDPIAAIVDGKLYPCKKYGSFIIVGPVGGGNNGANGIYWNIDYYRGPNGLGKFRTEGYDMPTNSQWTTYQQDPTIALLGRYYTTSQSVEGYGSNVWIWRNSTGIIESWIYDGNSWSVAQPSFREQCVLLLAKSI